MKKAFFNLGNLSILGILVLTNCADIPDDLREEAKGNKSSSSDGGYVLPFSSSSSWRQNNLSSSGGYSSPSGSSSSWRQSSSSYGDPPSDCESVFNPSTHFCYAGNVYPRCNSMEYNPTTHICQGGVANPARCDGLQYNPLEHGCCVSAMYSLANQRCQSNVVETKCGTGNSYHNPETQFCNGNEVLSKCSGKEYNPANQKCNNGIVVTQCGTGNNYHNPATQFCNGNDVLSKCGGEEYDPVNQTCQNDIVVTRCGTGNIYHNPATEQCCVNSKFTIATQFCQGGTTVKSLCGDQTYTTSQFCQGGTMVKPLCGTATYTASQFCQAGTNAVKDLCGGQTYLATEYCSNGTKKTYGSVTLSGQTYKTVIIGTQTWMAENLNYAVAGSKCGNGSSLSDENTITCDTYGRLYNWATAMAGAASSNANPSGVQGVCPSGWHLPSQAEWNALTAFIQSDKGCSSCDAKHLKAESGWNSNGNGLDSYGFKALPGGNGSSGGDFSNVGGSGFWWSSYEYNSSDAYCRYMYYSESTYWSYCNKAGLYSVRCVKD